MSYQFMARICQTFAIGVCTFTIPVVYAENIQSFNDAFNKIQSYQGQAQFAEKRQQSAELNIQQSRLWQNPSLSISQDGFGANQEQEFNFAISQPLDVFGQRKLNKKMAQTYEAQTQLQQKLWLAQSKLVVKFAWSQFALAEVEKTVYAAQLKVSQSNLDSAKKRYQAGSIALVDYERSQIEALENQRLYQQAVLNHQVSARQLSNLWGETSTEINLRQNSLPWPDQSDNIVKNYIAEGWLEKLYALNIEQSTQKIENLRVMSRPNPTVNVGMTRTKTPNENNETTLGLGVNIPLNIFNRQQYSIPIAQNQKLLKDQQQQRELKQQILDIANHMHQIKGLRMQFDSATSQIRLAEKVQNRTLEGFQAGKFSITDVQQASSQLQTIRLGQLQILRQAWQSALSAEALSLGTNYEQISSSDAYTQLNKLAVSQIEDLMNGGVQQ